MNACVDSILPELRANMAALTPPAQVYFGAVPSTAMVPYCWIYVADDVPGGTFYGQMQTLVALHMYARSAREIQLLEDAAEFLDDYRAPNFGNAHGPRYTLQSKPRLPEDEGRYHTTATYLVDYADKRKLESG
jgi:hypothetical protein